MKKTNREGGWKNWQVNWYSAVLAKVNIHSNNTWMKLRKSQILFSNYTNNKEKRRKIIFKRMFYKKNNASYNQWVWSNNSNNRFFKLWILKEKF